MKILKAIFALLIFFSTNIGLAQTPQPTTVVEWYTDLYPINLNGVVNDQYSTDLMSWLNTLYPIGSNYAEQYTLEFGVTPNCTLVPNETPVEVQCPRDDLILEISG